MKKTLKFSFIIIFLLTCMVPLNIFATEPEPDPDTGDDENIIDAPLEWPVTIESYGYSFTIEGFAMELYEVPLDKINNLGEAVSQLETNGDDTESQSFTEMIKKLPTDIQNEFFEVINSLIGNTPAKSENLTTDDIEIYHSGVVNSSKTLVFGADYEMSDEFYERYNRILNNPFDTEAGVARMPRIVTKIKFNKIPSEYKYVYYKDYGSIFINNAFDRIATVNGINLFQTNNYPLYINNSGTPLFSALDLGVIQETIELSKERLSGPTDYVDKRILIMPFSVNDMTAEEVDAELEAPLDNIMLSEHGKDYGITELNYQYRNNEPTQPKDLEVAVENTAATYPLYIYVLSAIGILVGALVIVSTRLQSKQKQIEQ